MRFFTAVLLWLWFHARVQAAQTPAFISPQWQDTTSKAPFAANSLWPLGSSQIVAFTAPWDSYRIEFWQGILSGGARKSQQLVYNQSEGETLPQSFYWTVQTYDLQLSQSPVFFFWLFDNNNSSNQQSSANFNITIDTASPSSSSALALLPSTSSVSSSTTVAATTTTPGTLSSSSPPGATDISTGLSRGAAAGIGVGAALGGVIIVAAAAFLFWRRRQQGRPELPGSELPGSEPTASSFDSLETAAALPTDGYYPKPVEAAGYEQPVEAPAYHHQRPIELG
ncbi:hypothetical protein CIB48_g1900 [Xylaria polymorpha]|nr:hypothetical protein CIB48_g1900 [Xylaria polymorpha]